MRNHPLILIADDQTMLRQMLRDALASEGYEFIEASTGHQAIDLFRQHKPDIVLLDVIMPGIDGPNACAALRALPEGHTVPILMITGRDDDQTINIAFAAGADDYITKPCNMLVLRHRVKRLLEAERHRKVIEQMAMIDGLTGLLNRRMLTQKLTQAMRSSRDSKKPLSLILLDIDHFKKINDTYGHDAGDAVIAGVAELLRTNIRESDIVARFGGEEFCVVFSIRQVADVFPVMEKTKMASPVPMRGAMAESSVMPSATNTERWQNMNRRLISRAAWRWTSPVPKANSRWVWSRTAR